MLIQLTTKYGMLSNTLLFLIVCSNVSEVHAFFINNHQSIAKFLNVSTMEKWRRNVIERQKGTASTKGRGRKHMYLCCCYLFIVNVVYVMIVVFDEYRYPMHLRIEAQAIIKEMGENGSPMNREIAFGVAHAVLTNANLESLYGFGPNQISLSDSWIYELMHEVQLVPRVGGHNAQTLPDDWQEQCERIISVYCCVYLTLLEMCYRIANRVFRYNIPPELVINLDQMGLMILQNRNKTWVKKGTKSVGVLGGGDKRLITAVPIVTASGKLVSVQLIFAGKTTACEPPGYALCFAHC